MEFIHNYKPYVLSSSVVVLALIIVAISFNLVAGASKGDAEIDVTKYEVPEILQTYISENDEIANGYISGSKVYSATEQKVKSDTVYTYFVQHMILPEKGKFYDIEDGQGIKYDNIVGDSLDHKYDIEETFVQKVYQIIVDRKGNHKIYTY